MAEGGASAGRDRLWFGTAALGRWGTADEAAAVEVVRHALDEGIEWLDTADSYSEGDAERIVGQAVRGRRDQVRVATKFGYEAAAAGRSLTRPDVLASLEASLERLGTDHVDLYQLHRLGPDQDLEPVLEALDDLVAAGKVLAVGTSSLGAEALEAVHSQAAVGGHPGPTYEQPPYSLFVRELERSALDACRHLGIHVVGHAPLNGGWLTGKYRQGRGVPTGSRAATWTVRSERFDLDRRSVARKLELVEALDEVALDVGTTLKCLAVAFALTPPGVRGTVIGARDRSQLDALLPAADLALGREVLARLDAIVPPGTTVDPADLAGYSTLDNRQEPK